MSLLVVFALLAAACSDPADLATAPRVGSEPPGDVAADRDDGDVDGNDGAVADDDVAPLGPTTSTTVERPTLPPLPTPVPPPDPVTVLAVGNLSECGQRDTEVAALVRETEGVILSAGDLAPRGTEEFLDDCFLPLYEDDLERMITVPGNHDLATDDGAAFYAIAARTATESDDGKGWFVTTAGGWQIIGLNSRCADVGGCDVGSEQYRWLDEVLRDQPAECRLAVWHDPRFTSASGVRDATDMGPIYGRLHGAGTDIVISGGPANYERLGPLKPNGEPADVGIVNFNVGIGGAGLTGFGDEPRPGSEVRLTGVDGVLSLELGPEGYDWELLATPESLDRSGIDVNESGSGTC